jgi:hypothetical protein
MSLYLTAIDLFKKIASEIQSPDLNKAESPDYPSNNNKITVSSKSEQNPDSFTSQDNQTGGTNEKITPNSENTKKPSTLFEKLGVLAENLNPLTIFKNISDTTQDLTVSLVEKGQKLHSDLSTIINKLTPTNENSKTNKFDNAQNEHLQRMEEINNKTELAKNLAEKSPPKSDSSSNTSPLSSQEIREFRRYLNNLYQEKKEAERLYIAQQEAIRSEQARLERERTAERQARERQQQLDQTAQKNIETLPRLS